MEDEIDLGKYLQVLIKHWKIIAGVTLAAVVIAAGVTFLTPRLYESRATVLWIGDNKTSIGIMVGMAKSPAVAAGAAEKLADKLDAGERGVGALLNAVSVAAHDNLIDVTARSASPQKAADIANAWTEAYISYATDYYKKLQPTSEELKTQTAAALALYNETNSVLSDFQDQIERNDTGNCLACAELLYEVQMLRHEAEADPDRAPDNGLSRVFYQYQAKAYGAMFPGAQISTVPPTSTVQQTFIVLPTPTEAGQVTLADIDQLISMLEKKAGVSGQSPELLLKHISEMKLKKDSEDITLYGLTLAKDTARCSYLEAVKQSVNAEMARESPKPQLKSIEIAVPVETPVTSFKWVNIGVALVLGLIAGVFVAFGIEYFRKKKPVGTAEDGVIASEAKQSVDAKT